MVLKGRWLCPLLKLESPSYEGGPAGGALIRPGKSLGGDESC